MLKVQILQGILMKDLGLSWATKLSFLLKSLIPVQLLCILTSIQGLIPQRNFMGIQLIFLKFFKKSASRAFRDNRAYGLGHERVTEGGGGQKL